MTEFDKLHRPWFIAVWPGMGQVAVSAGYYLMSKLGMHLMAELSAEGLFDVEHVEVRDGIIRTAKLPRNRFFVWRDPDKHRDLVVFVGEAQPPQGKYAFCHRLVEFAQELGVEQIFTFAAMATQMHPEHKSRVFCAATDEATLQQLQKLELDVLESGHISGLNGVLLGAAADVSLRGACLLGEMPHIFTQFPFPKASLAVLRVFSSLANIEVDVAELEEQAQAMEDKLGELLAKVERSLGQAAEAEEEEPFEPGPQEEALSGEDEARIEQLFEKAKNDKAKAYELKRELDRLDVFARFEDRFLDLFRKPE